jgi:anti-anti-sigma factor
VLIEEENNVLILDLVALDYISSAGLRSILTITKKLKEKDGKLLIARIQGMVKKVFEISGFHSIISIFDSVESARLQI